MIAIAKIGGHQALITQGEILEVDKLNAKEGETVQFPVLLTSDEDAKDFTLGAPFVEGVTVEAKVLEHTRGDKVRVFKMKPRKRYRKTLGHRQDYTVVEILSIGGTTKKAPAKKTTAKAEETKAAPKKAAAKKPAAKKTTTKKAE